MPQRPGRDRALTRRATRAVALLAWSALPLLCAGCASDVRLRNPETGHVTVCYGGFHSQGLAGLLDGSAKRLQTRCLDDYRQQGYVRAP